MHGLHILSSTLQGDWDGCSEGGAKMTSLVANICRRAEMEIIYFPSYSMH